MHQQRAGCSKAACAVWSVGPAYISLWMSGWHPVAVSVASCLWMGTCVVQHCSQKNINHMYLGCASAKTKVVTLWKSQLPWIQKLPTSFLSEALCNRFLFPVIYLSIYLVIYLFIYLFLYQFVCGPACWFHSWSCFNWTLFLFLWFVPGMVEYWALTISQTTLVEWAFVFNNYTE